MTLMMNAYMRYLLVAAGAGSVLIAARPAAADVWLAEGYEVESYGHVAVIPGAIDFDNAGALFIGNEEGDDKFKVQIFKIEAGGGEGVAYGDILLPDPDAVVVDKDGAFNGMPGAVLVGGHNWLTGYGYVAYILPDGTTKFIWDDLEAPENPDNMGRMTFDTNDRLLISAGPKLGTYRSPNPSRPPSPLAPGYEDGPQTVATDANDRFYTSSSEGTVSFYSSAGGDAIVPDFATNLGFITELVVGPGADWGTDLYASNTDGELYRIRACGKVNLIGSGFNRIASITFGPGNALYIADFVTGDILKLTITTPPSCLCPWDFDGDGNVGVSDLLDLLANWGPCP